MKCFYYFAAGRFGAVLPRTQRNINFLIEVHRIHIIHKIAPSDVF